MAGLDPGPMNRLPQSYGRSGVQQRGGGPAPANLADILERVLDKGIVIAGDIQINLLDIELLTIKLRLLVASVDRAREMGINWWESDPQLSSGAEQLEDENRELRERVERLEKQIEWRTSGTDTR
jgi:gas vesicle protein GvpA/GvpJ/GvpM family